MKIKIINKLNKEQKNEALAVLIMVVLALAIVLIVRI